MRGVRLQWAVLIAQGGSRGRAGSSWFLSLRLRLAINVFSCIFSNGVMRDAPVSHKLMCRWSYPFIYTSPTFTPRNTYPHVPIQQGCRDILLSPDGAGIEAVPSLPPWRRDEDGHSNCPSLSPWRRDEADSMQGAGLSRQGGFND